MKPAKLLLFLLLSLAMLFAACGNSPTPDPLPPEADKVLVSVDYVTDELLNQYDSFLEFVEFEDENYQKIVFTTNVPAKDFKFIEIDFSEEDGDIVFFEKEVLYSLDELTAEKPFLVDWIPWGAIPHRGISFVDEKGDTRYFSIIMSGEDGSLYLDEFTNESGE